MIQDENIIFPTAKLRSGAGMSVTASSRFFYMYHCHFVTCSDMGFGPLLN